jgi:hypothetical protein
MRQRKKKKKKKKKEWKDHQIKMKLKKALENTNKGKAPSLENIPPKLLKEAINLTENILCNLFEKIWKQEKFTKTG